MHGKFVEINPDITLRVDGIQAVRASTDHTRMVVHTDHHGVLEVVPLAGETLDMARRRIFAAVSDDEDGGMQLIEIDKDCWIDPADVIAVQHHAERNDIVLTFRGEIPGMFIHDQNAAVLAVNIVGRINAVMRERRRGLSAV